MSLTRDFRETIKARAERDPAFREELLREGAECLLSDDLETGEAVLKAARIGIADIKEERFRSFDAPEPLRRHLSTLAEDAISDSGAAETQG